ncbi:unnamed protein product [Didymodactylos carnosus]|uniref:Doublecortin domain-containing protein n=1 Tax=Didymodactylos carnosus TaxID=1234261 RepID=A0A813ZWU3_9BILA|nr:unnamed protein product [Didymodactylos carnosus]CAF1159695.1 unnamed protein product [Didymodactylos carnosus]CAF3686612.1 unnamed protein product [Didymodactylos carnosus]CAF3971337.1 unnamed protein product [Didymodactylos carnosus]
MTDVLSSHWQQQSHNRTTNPTSTTRSNYRRTLPHDYSQKLNVSRKITVFRNGDRYFAGKQFSITPQRYSSLGQLLQDLSSTVDLPYGVRRLFTPKSGSEVTDVQILKDGASYVCASFEPFQKLDYNTQMVPKGTFNIEQG